MRLCSAEVGSIDPQNRIVTQLPLRELWDSAGNVPAQRVRDSGRAQIRALLRAGPVRFVVADVGSTLGWISATLAHSFWKSQVQRHLANPTRLLISRASPADIATLPRSGAILTASRRSFFSRRFIERAALAREDRKVGLELREFLFGRKPQVFRVLFTIEGDNVRILRIRHAQRRPLTRRDINEANNPDEYGIEPSSGSPLSPQA